MCFVTLTKDLKRLTTDRARASREDAQLTGLTRYETRSTISRGLGLISHLVPPSVATHGLAGAGAGADKAWSPGWRGYRSPIDQRKGRPPRATSLISGGVADLSMVKVGLSA